MLRRAQCSSCHRADIAEHNLRLTTVARGGTLYEVCQLCFPISELHGLATIGGLSAETLELVESLLALVYSIVRRELEDGGR